MADAGATGRIVARVMGKSICSDELRIIATRVLSHREMVAQGLVRTGRWEQAEADRRTAPWKAIAVLCRVNTLQIEATLASYRRPLVFIPKPGQRLYNHIFPEDYARCLLATDICSAAEWCAALREATSSALSALDRGRTDANLQAACDLLAISRALEASPDLVGVSPDQRCAA